MYGSLSNLSLFTDPLTDNRYDLAGGNPVSFTEWDGHMALADGGGGASTTPVADRCGGCLDRPVSTDSRPAPKQQQSCSLTDPSSYGTCLRQHKNDFRNVAKGAEAVAGVASAVGTVCAIAGVVTAATVVGGAVGEGCAGAAFGVAAAASGVAAVANLGAKAGGADVSNTDIALDVVGAVPGIGIVGRGAKAAEAGETAARGIQGLSHVALEAKTAVADVAESCAVNSFSPGTLVRMADGSKKPIKQLKVGDKVAVPPLGLTEFVRPHLFRAARESGDSAAAARR